MSRARLVAAVAAPLLTVAMAAATPPSPRPREAYLQALVGCARGELEEAVATMVDLETSVGDHRLVAGAVRSVSARVVRRIARRRPEALLPVALLHQRVFLAHAEEGAPTRASAASRQAETVAQAYARASGDRVLGAALLTRLAGDWHARSQEGVAAPLYRQALGLDPQQPAALLGLAAVQEKRGSLREAAALLEAVERVAPGDREVRLRLALVRARSGRDELALAMLDELAAQGGDDWIVALTHQERARLLASTGRLGAALAAARAGQAALPCDPVLPVLAAYYGERAGVATGGLSQSLTACATERRGTAPRRLYNQQPRRLLDRLQLQLEQAERERLPALAAALDGGRAR
ncbi:MAG TPA: tetratricopeptide repeat protein [Thermoanaerobaculia bacterium]|nr:tetratricopeptide repeat protein [Thermoanaerobaculia bacterium]